MNDDLKTYLEKMPRELKEKYEFVKYKFGENWKDHFYKKSLNWLDENENVLNPQPLINYDGTAKQQAKEL